MEEKNQQNGTTTVQFKYWKSFYEHDEFKVSIYVKIQCNVQ